MSRAVSRVPTPAAAAAALIAVLAVAFAFLANLGDPQKVLAITDVADALAALVSALTCAWAAGRTSGHFRVGWALMSASAGAWLAGRIALSFYELQQHAAPPFPSYADIGYLVAVPLTMAGILSFWRTSQTSTARWVSLVDGLIILSALAVVSWIFGLGQIFANATQPWTTAISLSYPFGDTLIITVLILSISRTTSSQRTATLLLLGGLSLISVANAVGAFATTVGGERMVAEVADLCWVPGFLMIALAAQASTHARRTRIEPYSMVGWQLALPSIAVWIAGACLVFRFMRGDSKDAILSGIVVTMASLLAVSQLIAHRDALQRLVKSRQSEALLTEMVAHARRGIARTDRNLRMVAVNPGMEVLLGEAAENLIGSPITKYLVAENEQRVDDLLGPLMRGEVDSLEFEFPAIRSDGKKLWVGASSYAIRNEKGVVDFALTYLEDLTSKHESEESARRSLRVLENLNQVRMDFIRSISHDFKTGLVGIKGFSELIRDTDHLDIEEAKSFADEINRSADRLDALVTEMTDLDGAETRPISLSVERVDLNEVVLQEVAKFESGAHEVTTNLATELPVVSGDPSKLAEVVRILLQSAHKYSPVGGRIDVSTAVSLGEVMVNVRDEGVGVRADFDNRLFGSGDLYSNNPIRKVVGTGLGLGIASRIVEMHGGHIWLERLEQGSAAHFTVPVAGPMTLPGKVA